MVLQSPSSKVASDLSLSRSMSSRFIDLIMGNGHQRKHLHTVGILKEDPLCKIFDEISVEQYFVNIKQELSYRKPLPILRQRSKSSGLVDNVIAESCRPASGHQRGLRLPHADVNERKTSLEIVPISKISNFRGADQKYKLNCNGKAIM
ncbi:hypothetical protein J6590_059694 [Homalodisca vitripennis]|nr:hypothetical protein J6590_059694 [Homalodisca vitripennis]